MPPNSDLVSTQKGDTIYLHVLAENKDTFLIPGFQGKIKSMTFDSGKKVNYTVNEFGLTFGIPEEERDAIDTIITMRVQQ